ncbi:hypothetical protein [Galbibacter sp. BG1]
MAEVLIYRLKDGLKPASWQLRQNNVFIERFKNVTSKRGGSTTKESVGERQIQYVRGAKSFWVEDNTDPRGVQKEPTSVWFENGSLVVPKTDKVLIEYLSVHPDVNKKYELYDEDKIAKAELDEFELVEKVLDRLRGMTKDELRALSIIKYGLAKSKRMGDSKVKLELHKDARTNPKTMLENYLNDKDVEDQLFTALALESGIIKTTADNRSVIWGDTGHEIIKLGKGERPIETMTEFLKSDDGLETKQSIGSKVEKKSGKKINPKTGE